MVINDKLGGRTVELYIPFEHGNRQIDRITLKPFRFGDTLRWGEGAWQTSLAMLAELAGMDESVIRDLRYPDADRVFDAFISMLPPDIRNDIAEGRVPIPREKPAEEKIVTNGSGAVQPVDHSDTELPSMLAEPASKMVGPGVPLPEAGFDLSEEE